MQMHKKVADKKSAEKKTSTHKKSAMERYADQRNASLRLAHTPDMIQHDPAGDVYHLQKAAEINGDESRKRAARSHAAKEVKKLHKVLGK